MPATASSDAVGNSWLSVAIDPNSAAQKFSLGRQPGRRSRNDRGESEGAKEAKRRLRPEGGRAGEGEEPGKDFYCPSAAWGSWERHGRGCTSKSRDQLDPKAHQNFVACRIFPAGRRDLLKGKACEGRGGLEKAPAGKRPVGKEILGVTC